MKLLTAFVLSCLVASTAHAAECAKACPAIYAPVCGSNGKTYSNECAFNLEKCKANDAALTLAKPGECAGNGGGGGSGTPECVKEFACLDVEDPVCGSNGVTYTNSCVLKKAQCVDKSIQKASDGACKTDATMAPSSTPSGSTSAPSSAPSAGGSGSDTGGDVVCTKACTKEIDYVCGSDGATYANECLLEQKKECETPTLTKASDGQCGSGSGSAAESPSVTTAPASSQPPPVSSSAASSWTVTGAATLAGCVLAAAVMF